MSLWRRRANDADQEIANHIAIATADRIARGCHLSRRITGDAEVSRKPWLTLAMVLRGRNKEKTFRRAKMSAGLALAHL
jgi:hypothetical protein